MYLQAIVVKSVLLVVLHAGERRRRLSGGRDSSERIPNDRDAAGVQPSPSETRR